MSYRLNYPGQAFCMCESQFCHFYSGILHVSLKNLRDNVCVTFCKMQILKQI